MLIVDNALARRAAEGNPIRVGMIGAGFQGRGIGLQIMTATPGISLCAVANRHVEAAVRVFEEADRQPVRCDTTAEIDSAIARGHPVVTDDANALAAAESLDAIIEVTGSIEYATLAIMTAISSGKHVIQMNAELDGTIGPILKRKADQAGVIYTFSDGDQPGVQMNLYRFVQGLGIKPVLCGNIKGLHDPYRNPETQRAFAERWGQKPAMVASFADGTKISFEQAVVANGTGMQVAQRGMLGPDFSKGNPNAPLIPVEESISFYEPYLEAAGSGLVDYVVGARPGPGVFVIGKQEDPRKRHYLELYKLGKGPYYCFYTPYHLCHFEVPTSVARAVLFNDSVLTPRGGPQVGVVAVAKKDLCEGEHLVEFGGYEVYGVAENIDTIRKENLLPIGLAIGSVVRHPIRKDSPLTFDDVRVPEGRLVDRLYDEQEHIYARTETLS